MKRITRHVIFVGFLFTLAVFSQTVSDNGIRNIGTRRELFVDDYLIETMVGEAELLLHKPVMKEVVLIHDAPWEGNTCGYHITFQDGDLYRMYYRGSDAPNFQELRSPVTCMAISTDGIHWEKPNLGII